MKPFQYESHECDSWKDMIESRRKKVKLGVKNNVSD